MRGWLRSSDRHAHGRHSHSQHADHDHIPGLDRDGADRAHEHADDYDDSSSTVDRERVGQPGRAIPGGDGDHDGVAAAPDGDRDDHRLSASDHGHDDRVSAASYRDRDDARAPTRNRDRPQDGDLDGVQDRDGDRCPTTLDRRDDADDNRTGNLDHSDVGPRQSGRGWSGRRRGGRRCSLPEPTEQQRHRLGLGRVRHPRVCRCCRRTRLVVAQQAHRHEHTDRVVTPRLALPADPVNEQTHLVRDRGRGRATSRDHTPDGVSRPRDPAG